jgi:hypothetical protein
MADLIVSIESGYAVEIGDHATLLARAGVLRSVSACFDLFLCISARVRFVQDQGAAADLNWGA